MDRDGHAPQLEDGSSPPDAAQAPVSLTSLVRESMAYGLIDVANKGIGFVLLPVTTHYLSRADFGIGNIFGATAQMLLLIVSMGLPTSLMRFHTEAAPGSRRRLVATAFGNAAIYAVVGLVPIIAFAGPISRWLFDASDPFLGVALAAVTAATLFDNLGSCRLQAGRSMRLFLSIQLLGLMIGRSFFLGLIVAGYGVRGWVVSDLIGESLIAGLMILFAWRDIRAGWDGATSRRLLFYGGTLVPVAMSHWVMTASDRYMLRYMLPQGFDEVGLYSIGERLSSPMQLVNLAFLFSWRRFAFSNMGLADGPQRLARGITWFALVGGMIALAICLLSDDLLRWFFRPEYAAGATVIPPLTLAALVWGIGELLAISAHKANRTIHLAWLNVAAAIGNVLLNLILIPSLGILGAATSTLACQFLKTLVMARIGQALFPIPFERKRLALLGAGLLGAAGAAQALTRLGPVASSLGQVMVVAATPAALWVMGFFTPEERRRVGAFFSRRDSSG